MTTAPLLFLVGGLVAGALVAATPATEHEALVNKYCIGCHSNALKSGGIVLEKRDFTKISEDARVWEKAIRKLRAGEMPPIGAPRPDAAAIDSFASWLETSIDAVAATHPNPGRTMVHRLNRAEYQNAIRDVLDLNVDAAGLLPPDDSADGFDNIAQMLTISPALLQSYISASAKIGRFAVGAPDTGVVSTTYRPRPDLSQDSHVEGTPIGTLGGIAFEHYFPLDGEYVFSPKLSESILGMIHGLEDEHAVEVTMDGVRVKFVHFGGNDGIVKTIPKATEYADYIHARMAFRIPVKAGPHRIAVAFLRQSSAQTAEIWQQYQRTALDANETKGFPHLDKITIEGPYNPSGPGDTPSRRRIFTCRPRNEKDELPCARQILTSLARRAYRRPLSDADTEKLLTFFQRGRNHGSFDQGIEMGDSADYLGT